jgi:hypothetical protein
MADFGLTVGHAKNTGSGMLEREVFIGKLVPVDGFPAGTIVIGKVPSLAHKARDDAMEGGTRKTESLFPSAESTKVLGGLGDNVTAVQYSK